MDLDSKQVPHKVYDNDVHPAATLYTGVQPTTGEPMHGIPLYPEYAPANPPLGRFVVQGCQDLWAALLFIGTVFMVIVWGSINVSKYHLMDNINNGSSSPYSGTHLLIDNSSTIITLIVVFLISVVSASALLLLIRSFPRQLIYIANVASVLINFALAVVAFAKGIIFLGVMLLIISLLHGFWFYFVRSRVPLAAELLKVSSSILSRYIAIFLFNILLSFVSGVYIFFWGFMMAPPATRINNSKGGAGDGVLLTFFVLCFFWAFQVVPNLMHVTTAGVAATWYFAGEGQMPPNPTVQSFKRATTTSFGSVCFGSLIVAFIRLLRWLAQSAGENDNEFIRCITVCILQCLENLVEYFNTYAFVHVAVYGCSYIEAAKRTWALCKECGFAAYFNDVLVGTTLNLIAFVISMIIGLTVGLMSMSVAYGSLAFVLAFMVHGLFFSAVESTVTTLFVCFAEMPEGLQHSAPDLYAALHAADQNGTGNNAMNP